MQALEFSLNGGMARRDIAPWRKILSVLLLVSFTWISYLAQTHIHGTPALAAASAIVKSQVQKSPANTPSDDRSDDGANCPLCQAVNLGGVFIAPFVFLALAVQWAVQVPLQHSVERIPAGHTDPGHQTRGPPIF